MADLIKPTKRFTKPQDSGWDGVENLGQHPRRCGKLASEIRRVVWQYHIRHPG